MARHDREESLEEQLAWLDAIKESEEAPVPVSASAAAADEPVASPYPQDPWLLVPAQHDTPTPPLFRAAVDSVYGAAAAEDLPESEAEAAEWLGTAGTTGAAGGTGTKEAASTPGADDPFHAPLRPLPRPDDTDSYSLSFTPPEPVEPPAAETAESSWSTVPEWARAPEPEAADDSSEAERPEPESSDTLPSIQPPKWTEPEAAPAGEERTEEDEQPEHTVPDVRLSWTEPILPLPAKETLESPERPQEQEREPESAPQRDRPLDVERSRQEERPADQPEQGRAARPEQPEGRHQEERPQWPEQQNEWRPADRELPPPAEQQPEWGPAEQQPEWRPADREIPAEQQQAWRPADREIPPPPERRRHQAPIPVFTAPPRPPVTGRPTAESLDPEYLLRGRRNAPSKGWRRMVYKASGGWIKPGEPPEVRRRRELMTRARTPVTTGHHRVAVLSLKGGVGKTTTTVGLGATLAQIRGDRVIAVDANPDRGTLSDKLVLETSATVRDLLNERDQVKRYVDIRAFTSQAPSRLEVLASDRDPSVSEAFSGADYQDVSQVLENFYSICITDCGTGLLHSAMGGVLGLADQIVLVSSPSVDGARAASATLDWLEAHHYGDLVKNATVVLCSVRPRTKSAVDIKKLEAHFAARCRAVVRVPYDPHLEEGAEIDLDRLQEPTREAYLQLAACVGDGFAGVRE
ncbi:MinD/ParA family ATP-binding protein [Nonomuraea phyllanthi]|uniref:MinD/ParA family ATP-binding protein n=1 Tax=Nonomuraea phyllanthi TaxID=2219224 RepID=UPI001D156D96|nr:MinD/ParA family protein [Nonomuraea phyllanthi]